MTLSVDTVYWIFSTLPQVIAAMAGLSIAGMTFSHGNLDAVKERDDSLTQIIDRAKDLTLGWLLALLLVSGLVILLDVIALYYADFIAGFFSSPSRSGCTKVIWALLTTIVNSSPIAILIYLLNKLLKSDFKDKIIKELSDKFTAESRNNRYAMVDAYSFLHKFIEFERLARKIYPDENGQVPKSIRQITFELINTGILNKSERKEITEFIQIRNLIVHGDKIDKVPQIIDDKLQSVINQLNSYLSKHTN